VAVVAVAREFCRSFLLNFSYGDFMKTALQPPPPPPVENGPDQFTGRQAPFGLSPRAIISAAASNGVTFLERVADGELVVAGLEHLASVARQRLQANWGDIRDELLPADHSTPSLRLVEKLGIELVYIGTEERAVAEVPLICESVKTLGLDLETAPRPEFLPPAWPIRLTKDGRRSKVQKIMDTSAALDPFRAEIRLLQVAAQIGGRMVVLVIDLRRVPLGSRALASLWDCRLVGHNIGFDFKILAANGVRIADANLVDTILMAGLMLRGVEDMRREGSRRPSLEDAVKEALGVELPKQSQLSPWWRDQLTQEQIAYAALDAASTLKLAVALAEPVAALRKGPDGKTLLGRLCAAVGPVTRVELAGVTVDREALAKQASAWDEELAALEDEIAAKLSIKNPSSAPQVVAWLSPELERLDAAKSTNWASSWPRTSTGCLSTKAKHLARLIDYLPAAALLVRFSKLKKLHSNFGIKLLESINPHTGRLHGSFQIAGAKSGRFASSKPNMQNIPKAEAIRSVFVAGPGKQLVVADYSQLELRVMAHIANDAVMTEAYRSGLDLHAVTAAVMLGIGLDQLDIDLPAHKEARQKAKAINFGVIYGSGPDGLKEFDRDAYNLQISLQETRTLISRFLVTFRGVARWQRKQEARTKRTKNVSTVGGRVYRFAWEAEGEYRRNLALNLPIQGTAAEIAIEAFVRIDARLRAELPGRAQLVLQVHDEFVVEVEDEESVVSAAKRILEQEMIAAFEALLPDAPTTGLVTAHCGSTWAAARG
jgi:DNA polymerase I-like protein with 3'-5' exonuclease and polymerase domains